MSERMYLGREGKNGRFLYKEEWRKGTLSKRKGRIVFRPGWLLFGRENDRYVYNTNHLFFIWRIERVQMTDYFLPSDLCLASGAALLWGGPQIESKQNSSTGCCSQPLRTGRARKSPIKGWLSKEVPVDQDNHISHWKTKWGAEEEHDCHTCVLIPEECSCFSL